MCISRLSLGILGFLVRDKQLQQVMAASFFEVFSFSLVSIWKVPIFRAYFQMAFLRKLRGCGCSSSELHAIKDFYWLHTFLSTQLPS